MINQSEFRIERDSLGQVQVPATALYGAQTQRALMNFPISGQKPYWSFVWGMVVIKRSAAIVNHELGLLKRSKMESILAACDEILAGHWTDHFVVDPFQAGAGTSHNMNVNEVIANRATQLLGGQLGKYIVDPNNHVNMSQSTNDTIPTAIRLGCLSTLDEFLHALGQLSNAFTAKAIEFDGILKSGRTHLQDAVPIRLGQEFGAYARILVRDQERIIRSADSLRRIGIGGTAAGTGLNAHPEYHQRMVSLLMDYTGLALRTSDNLFESMQSMADMVDYSASLRTLSISLTKIANDLRLLSSGPKTGISEIILPAVQPGSSIMPGKVNPVMAEMLNMVMFHVMGNDHAVSLASQNGQLELNVMMPVIAHNLFEMNHILIGAIQAFTDKCVAGIQANTENTRRWLENNPIIVTAITPLIGYKTGAELIRYADEHHLTIHQAIIDFARSGKLVHLDSGNPITEDEAIRVIGDLRKMTDGGIL